MRCFSHVFWTALFCSVENIVPSERKIRGVKQTGDPGQGPDEPSGRARAVAFASNRV